MVSERLRADDTLDTRECDGFNPVPRFILSGAPSDT